MIFRKIKLMNSKVKKKNVGIFIFDSVEILDFAGPYEVFASTRLTKKSNAIIHKLSCPFNVFTFTEKKKSITCTGGLTVKSGFTLNNCPKLDLLIVPGGIGTRILLKNNNILNWLVANKDINIIASVCTGSLLLAKAGLLDNKKATSHWGALELLKKLSPSTQILKNKKFVYDKYYTSAGVSAGINMSLHIIEKLLGKKIAQNTAKYIEYNY